LRQGKKKKDTNLSEHHKIPIKEIRERFNNAFSMQVYDKFSSALSVGKFGILLLLKP